jgi:hypothetical protein
MISGSPSWNGINTPGNQGTKAGLDTGEAAVTCRCGGPRDILVHA